MTKAKAPETQCSRCESPIPDCKALNCPCAERVKLPGDVTDPAYARCDNCGAEYTESDSDASEISDFYERIANNPGGMIPAGQCTCGSLTYPIAELARIDADQQSVEFIASELRARLVRNLKGRSSTTTITGWINRTVTAVVLQGFIDRWNKEKA